MRGSCMSLSDLRWLPDSPEYRQILSTVRYCAKLRILNSLNRSKTAANRFPLIRRFTFKKISSKNSIFFLVKIDFQKIFFWKIFKNAHFWSKKLIFWLDRPNFGKKCRFLCVIFEQFPNFFEKFPKFFSQTCFFDFFLN